jgi:hypothetical protein
MYRVSVVGNGTRLQMVRLVHEVAVAVLAEFAVSVPESELLVTPPVQIREAADRAQGRNETQRAPGQC